MHPKADSSLRKKSEVTATVWSNSLVSIQVSFLFRQKEASFNYVGSKLGEKKDLIIPKLNIRFVFEKTPVQELQHTARVGELVFPFILRACIFVLWALRSLTVSHL